MHSIARITGYYLKVSLFLCFFLFKERKTFLSTKFLVFNRRYSTVRVEKRRFPGFQQESPQTVQKSAQTFFRIAIGRGGVFHRTNSPYYDYYHS